MLENNVNNPQQIPQFQAVNPTTAQGGQVPMQAVNPELLKQNVQDSYVSSRVTETTDDPKGMMYTGLLAIPSWFAIAKGMDKFAEKTRGDYDKTIYHKILSLHIFIQSKEAKSSFLSNKIVVSIIPNSFLQGSKKRFQVHF